MNLKEKKLLVITTHPIQYIVPWFKELDKELDGNFKVLFLREPDSKQQGIGFGKEFEWDIPLREGYQSHVISPKGKKEIKFLSLIRIFKFILEYRPNAIMITGWNDSLLVFSIQLSKLMHIPVILRGESNDLRERSIIKKVFHKALLKRTTAVLKIGSANERFYIQNGIQPNKIFDGCYFVNNKLLYNQYIQYHEKRTELRALYKIPSETITFLFVGKFVEFKNPLLLIDAASKLIDEGYHVNLLFVGSGNLEQKMKAFSVDKGVSICFTGFLNQNELWKGYLAADIFVLPSNNEETWGLVTNEAMIFGLPVLVSKQIGSAEDLLLNYDIGRIFEPEVNDLSTKMKELINEYPKNRQLLGQELIMNHFTIERATVGLKNALNKIWI